jgi:hypothetical protein
MAAEHGDRTAGWRKTTPFAAQSRADRIARLIVLDMVIWPGLLFVGITLFAAYQVREVPLASLALIVATLWSVAVGVHQWNVMLRAALTSAPPRPASFDPAPGEDSPGPPAGARPSDRWSVVGWLSTNHQSPITDHRSPTTDHRSPTTKGTHRWLPTQTYGLTSST